VKTQVVTIFGKEVEVQVLKRDKFSMDVMRVDNKKCYRIAGLSTGFKQVRLYREGE